MKRILIVTIITAIVFTACNNSAKQTKESTTKDSAAVGYACPMHPEVAGEKGDKCPKCGMELKEVKSETSQTTMPSGNSGNGNFSIKEITTVYLQLKNALVDDNSGAAATTATSLQISLSSINKTFC